MNKRRYSLCTMVQSQGVESLTISRLAAAAGVGVETVRFYQRKGLLDTPDRLAGIRRYDSRHLHHLQFIRQAQAAGFTLEQIGELLDLNARDDRARARELAVERVKVLDLRIAELERARDALKRLARECARHSSGPCPILAAFDAGHGRPDSMRGGAS